MDRQKLWKLFRIPSPKDLGWSDTNALPIRDFNNGSDMHTWEDWEEKVQKEYPVRYFLSEKVPFWFRTRIARPVKDAKYWLVSHVVPSRRYHMLDLRQPKVKGEHSYRWGWIDSDTQMLYALFNILNNFIKHEMPSYYCPSEEEVQQEPHLLSQRNFFLEAKAIHRWWNIDRKKQQEAHAELLHNWSEARKANTPDVHRLWDELKKMEQDEADKEDEMIERLLKIRRSLWT